MSDFADVHDTIQAWVKATNSSLFTEWADAPARFFYIHGDPPFECFQVNVRSPENGRTAVNAWAVDTNDDADDDMDQTWEVLSLNSTECWKLQSSRSNGGSAGSESDQIRRRHGDVRVPPLADVHRNSIVALQQTLEVFMLDVCLPPPIRTTRRPTGAKLALKPVHVWGIRIRLQVASRLRDLALFDLGLDSKLRGCDVVALRVADLLSASGVRSRVMILQRKTGRPVQFEVTEQTRCSLAGWIEAKALGPDDWLFPSRSKKGAHLSTRQYARLVDRWVTLIGLDPAAYGTHSLRRTKVSLLYKKTGNLRACQLLLGHTKLESTVKYLGVEVDDALALSEGLEL